MMDPNRAKSIFLAASEKPRAQRAAFLNEAVGNDPALLSRVEALLKAHDAPDTFLDNPAAQLPTMDSAHAESPAERIGTLIGPYKLLEQIGEGGMGVVYLAEQQAPVRRKVALKVIKTGMDTLQVIARFEAERQALALMDHSNIARVFDAGATDAGRPYFVMELVRGIPITTYCDQNNLPIPQRLRLFVQICHAVQHAHQKGIIHRDLKPSNLLVTLNEGEPVPKVIDFGVAKAIHQQLTEKTLFTGVSQMIGTPLYMSPEQAAMTSLDVDTRSDIYSLGVLLYELLTGATPFDQDSMRTAARDEMCRIIREKEPPKPSSRLSTSQSLPSIAANRQLGTKQLTLTVSGDLDWIVMKSLEKDRNRRYETASGLAEDIAHYLADEPVLARPPSARYRFGKFARRNKAALAFTLIAVIFLIIVGGGSAWVIDDRSARQAKIAGQLHEILAEVTRLEEAQNWAEALETARRAKPALDLVEAPSEPQQRLQQALADLGFVGRLEEIRARSGTPWGEADRHQDQLTSDERAYALAFQEAGIDVDALSITEAARQIGARSRIAAALLPALDDWIAVRSARHDDAATRRLIQVTQTADPDPWRQQMRIALSHKDWAALENLARSPDLNRQGAATLSFLATACRENGKVAAGVAVLRLAQQKYPADFWINHRLGVDLMWDGTREEVLEGIGFLRAAVALRPQSSHSLMNLGNAYSRLGRLDDALACFQQAIAFNPASTNSYLGLGACLIQKGQTEKAITAYEQAIKSNPDYSATYTSLAILLDNCRDARFRNPPRAAELAAKAVEIEPGASNNWTALGMARYRLGQWQAARMAFDKSLQLATNNWGGWIRMDDPFNWLFLAMCDWQLGEKVEARKWYDKAVTWIEMKGAEDGDLLGFRDEAEELLNAKPSPDGKSDQHN